MMLSSAKMLTIRYFFTMFCLLTAKRTQSARSSPNPEADTSASAPEWTHLQETVISTFVAGMLPLIGSKSRTVAVASTLSITSPSMRAGDAGQLPELRESLWTWGVDGGDPERSRRVSRSRYGPDTPLKCCPVDVKQHGKFNGGCSSAGDWFD